MVLLSAAFAGRPSIPEHLEAKPDRQRATAFERLIIGRPFPSLVVRGALFMRLQLPRWIHGKNPSHDMRNRAGYSGLNAGIAGIYGYIEERIKPLCKQTTRAKDLRDFYGAQKRTRTSTTVKSLVPETSASTNSAIWARVGEAGV